MIKTRNLMFAAMSCIATMSLTSCATILSGSANKIYIDGDVDEPVTIVTEKQTYENVELPAMVKINRHGIDGQRVKIKSENYEYKDIVLEKNKRCYIWKHSSWRHPRLACRLGNKLCEHATEEALRHNGEAQEQKFVIEEQATDIDTRAFDVVSIHIKSSFYLLLYFNPQGLICIYFNTGKIVNRRVVLP